MFTCSTCHKEWPENYCPDCSRTIDRRLLEEELEAGGEVIRGTWAPCAAMVKLSRFRYLWLRRESRVLLKLAFIAFAMTVGGLAVDRWLFTAISLWLFALVAYLLWMVSQRTAEIYANAALTAGLVVSETPLEFISLANMDNAGGDAAYAVKRVAIDRLPCHSHAVGTEFPCVSGFHGEEEQEHWADFDPQPLSFGTGDKLVLQARANKLGAEAFTQLRETFRSGAYPGKAGELLWLAGDERSLPPPLPGQPPPLPTA